MEMIKKSKKDFIFYKSDLDNLTFSSKDKNVRIEKYAKISNYFYMLEVISNKIGYCIIEVKNNGSVIDEILVNTIILKPYEQYIYMKGV